eukprot:TRINITY_DN12051_c0_g1_i1.p1 TRINITY_DN12051_c0_g1~~TRINITY_DN12051_c0_g1_i1.p1  ORF type:complete len:322 (+),score=41.13 TRINITY_DN12051_c0_g1_i1:302-1267(+)
MAGSQDEELFTKQREWLACVSPTLINATCDPLSEAEVALLENRHQLTFPPQLREFLLCVHQWKLDGGKPCPLKNWREELEKGGQTESEEERVKASWAFDGLYFDVRRNGLWLDSWGAEPETEEAKETVLLQKVMAAPPLIPVYKHRFAISATRETSTDAVLSVWQSDIIIYGSNFKSYLGNEFRPMYDVAPAPAGTMTVEELCAHAASCDAVKVANKRAEEIRALRTPFWGELLIRNGYRLVLEEKAAYKNGKRDEHGAEVSDDDDDDVDYDDASGPAAPPPPPSITPELLNARLSEIRLGIVEGRLMSSELLKKEGHLVK